MSPEWRLAHLPALLAVTAVLLTGGAVVGWLAAGGVGATGAVAGAGLVSAGYLFSTLTIAWVGSARPTLLLPVALATYLGKVCVLGAVMLTLAAGGWPGLVPMAYGMVAGAVVWPAALVWWLVWRPRRSPNLGADSVSPDLG